MNDKTITPVVVWSRVLNDKQYRIVRTGAELDVEVMSAKDKMGVEQWHFVTNIEADRKCLIQMILAFLDEYGDNQFFQFIC